ncbi:MAG TPA: hypothetical protein ENN69_08150, partial [Spirochaetia bacterium]|nr:hypothetical protein [Spirochaetia bacterium]
LQAVEYGYTGYLPGGLKPVAFIFITVNPEFVDFNIHPAKREARFRNLPEIHAALVTLVKRILAGKNPERAVAADQAPSAGTEDENTAATRPVAPNLLTPQSVIEQNIYPPYDNPSGYDDEQGTENDNKNRKDSRLRYLGQIDTTYLAAIDGSDLVIVDQHAAHERLLFDRLRREPDPSQPLLIPIAFDTEEDEAAALSGSLAILSTLGIDIAVVGPTGFEIRALPAFLHGVSEKELILFLKNTRGSAEELAWRAMSLQACRGALKSGERLDEGSALELVKQALTLPDPHCPHGRPVYVRFSGETLHKLFKRTL